MTITSFLTLEVRDTQNPQKVGILCTYSRLCKPNVSATETVASRAGAHLRSKLLTPLSEARGRTVAGSGHERRPERQHVSLVSTSPGSQASVLPRTWRVFKMRLRHRKCSMESPGKIQR